MKDQKIALITGANRGIGFETAKQLGKKGITIVLAARSKEAANKAAEALASQGIAAEGIQLDVTSADERRAAAAYIAEKYGRLDILVNNAGVAPRESIFVEKTAETTKEEFDYVFETNFFSVVYLTRELLPLLKKSKAGRIVNLSSILGSLTLHAQPNSPLAGIRVLSYNASKAALNVFTVHLAAELEGTGIKVNSAHPGWVQTELGGNERAPMNITEGAKTSVDLALVEDDGPNGRFIHQGEELPW